VKIRWKRGQAIIALMIVMLLLVTAACGNSDDDDAAADAETPVASSTATTASADAAASPTERELNEDGTPTTAAASATEAEEDAPTSTTAPATATKAEESTATTASGEPTATEAAGQETAGTGFGTGDEDIPEIETLDPELLPNFSMTMNFEAANMSGTPQTTVKMQMEQSSVGNYHFVMEADGQPIEVWTVDGKSWTSVGGEVIESPTGPLFDPADILQTGELIPEGLNAREAGTEEVNGRQATKWVVDGADYVAFMNEDAKTNGTSTGEMTNGQGEVSVWVDNELNIMLKAEGDVTWDNSDGTVGSLVYDYEIHEIGTTADVVAPV
jgi:hypothetical protein